MLAIPNQRNTVLARERLPRRQRGGAHPITLRLLDGSIHTFLPGEKSYHKTDFTTYDVSLNLAVALARFSQREKDAQEMTLGELRDGDRRAIRGGTPGQHRAGRAAPQVLAAVRLPGVRTRRRCRSEFNRSEPSARAASR